VVYEDFPLDLGKNVADYLKELKQRFETVESFATEHSKKKPTQYTKHYNLCSRDKSFDVDEQVLILTPDSTSSKTLSKKPSVAG